MNIIAQRIKELREDRDIKQKEIADYLEIRQNVYSRYETEFSELPTHHLKKICMFYGVSADYILGLPKGLKYIER